MFELLKRSNRTSLFVATVVSVCLLATSVPALAQEGSELPESEGSVTDLANVLDSTATRRLENMLAALKERAGIELAIVTVKTTGGEKIFDYSQRLARKWDTGAMQSKASSLLLFVSADDGKFITQVSRRARNELPDGLLGEMGNRMMEPFGRRAYGEGLVSAVETFITKLAERRGFSLEGLDAPRGTVASATTAQNPQPTTAAQAGRPRQVTAPADPQPANPKDETGEAAREQAEKEPQGEPAVATKEPQTEPAATEPVTDTVPTKEPPAEAASGKETKEPSASEPAAAENAPPAETAKKSSLRDVFTKKSEAKESSAKTVAAVPRDSPERAELDAILALPPAERIEKLKAFIEKQSRPQLKTFAAELLVSAHAALGDEKLKEGDAVGGVGQFQLALDAIPQDMSDTFFIKVVSQLPLNLYLRGQRTAARDASRQIEAKVKDDPKRLVALTSFFLSIEDAEEAARLSNAALALAPEMADAHQMLGAAHHVGLRLDEAAAEYARARELDPQLASARRALADLRRATGKPEEALALYREQLAAAPDDKPARAGVVLSLLDLGRKEEAERELEAALKDDPANMALLVGAGYWHAAQGDPKRAEELALKAIGIEPRHVWAHVARARALVALKRSLEAELVLRFAQQFGKFPTLDYEQASALAASGLYEQAAEALSRSFTIKDGQLETRLGGRVPARAPDFLELLAPERRAGIFQATPADTAANARVLKGLFAFTKALGAAGGPAPDAAALASARSDFLSGDDPMRVFRQLYVASRLLARGVEFDTVIELADAAGAGVDAGLDEPVVTVAAMADELRDAHARAVLTGTTLPLGVVVPRVVLANILRGRIEDLKGWASFNQNKAPDAVVHLKRALSVLPDQSAWWRTAQWHMGAALEATGSREEALAAYLKAYNPASPNPVQRAIIEALYRRVHGSLEGLDEKIGPAQRLSATEKPPGE
ncbi:MAG TPA: TPM domain-containing protein [Pyrinomonadaceae bacterium]|nr:TPM domain-containing protein [Pyrinomonadaceae bacterium]